MSKPHFLINFWGYDINLPLSINYNLCVYGE